MVKNLDSLLSTASDTVRRLVPADPQSIVPVEYQHVGNYFLNDRGIHHFASDEDGELVVETVYPIPFRAFAERGGVRLHFFTGSEDVDVLTTLAHQTIDAFRSLSHDGRARINSYISACLLSG